MHARAAWLTLVLVAAISSVADAQAPGETEPVPPPSAPPPASTPSTPTVVPPSAPPPSAPPPSAPTSEMPPSAPPSAALQQPPSELEGCLQRRRDLYAQATAQTDLRERARILESMPECKAPPSREAQASAPHEPVLVFAPPTPEPPPPHAADTAKVSFMIGPLLPLAAAALGGMGIEGRVDAAVAPHLGVGVTAAYMSVPDLLSEDIMISVVVVHPHVAWYLRRFSGGFAGAELVYGSGHNTAGTGFLGGDVTEGSVRMLGAAAFAGWKWITRSGFTASVQLGIGVARSFDSSDGQPSETNVVPAGGVYLGWSF